MTLKQGKYLVKIEKKRVGSFGKVSDVVQLWKLTLRFKIGFEMVASIDSESNLDHEMFKEGNFKI